MTSSKSRFRGRQGTDAAGALVSEGSVGADGSSGRRSARIFRSVLLFAMAVACIGAGVFVYQQHQPYADGVSTTGTVTGAEKSRDKESVLYSRIFTFTASDGRKVSVTESESSSAQPDVGASVQVSYRGSDPESARIIPEHDWLPFALMGSGLLIALLGFVNLPRRRAQQAGEARTPVSPRS